VAGWDNDTTFTVSVSSDNTSVIVSSDSGAGWDTDLQFWIQGEDDHAGETNPYCWLYDHAPESSQVEDGGNSHSGYTCWAKTTQAPAPPQSWGTAIPTPPTPPPTAQPSTAAPDATVPGGSPWGGSYTFSPSFPRGDVIVVDGKTYNQPAANYSCALGTTHWAYDRNGTLHFNTYPINANYQALLDNNTIHFLFNFSCATTAPTISG
jgi:hypothetical protein